MSQPKQILLSLCGKTPQILTETLFCMMVQPEPPTPLDEIWLVTTTSGKKAVCQELLDKPNGKFYQFCREYDIDAGAIAFDESHILAPGDLSDIYNVHDNESFANVLTEKVWNLTKMQNTVLHCSIAGGRKTMSAYLAMIMQFFARPQDRMFHILTGSTDFENNAEFFYPPKTAIDITTRDGHTVNTRDAGLVLVDIPFIRLRDKIPEFQTQYYSFSEMVAKAQKWISHPHDIPHLIVDATEHILYIGSEYQIKMTHARFCIYRLFAEYSLNRPDNIDSENHTAYFIRGGAEMPEEAKQRLYSLYDRFASINKDDFWPRLQQEISKINRQIKEALGRFPLLDYYIIYSVGPYGETRYGIKLDKSRLSLRN